jgi:predicted HD phosphohydrolase
MTPEEKKTVAYHEAGHAIAGWFLEHADPLLKVTIIPRSNGALGFAQYLPKEMSLQTTEQFNDIICMALGGRAAEEICMGKITNGASNDLHKVTRMAHAMITLYGMNAKLGQVAYPQEQQQEFVKPYSEETARLIDQEVKALIDVAYERTLKLLKEKEHLVRAVGELLLEKETISQHDIAAIAGEREWKHPATYKEFLEKAGSSEDESSKDESSSDGDKKMSEEEAQKVAADIMLMFDQYGAENYIGENISQKEHMLQAAMEAEKEGFSEDVIVAAFLHDIGHMIGERDKLPSMDGWGTCDHDEVARSYLESKGFPKKVSALVKNHVQAKRYLCWKDKDYFARLSEASKETLKRQGGVMSDEEAKAFEDSGILNESIKMRTWDEAAKELDVSLFSFIYMIKRIKLYTYLQILTIFIRFNIPPWINIVI